MHNICKNANLMVEYSRVQLIEEIMKQSEFLRWLKSRGVEVTHGTRHLRLRVPGNPKTQTMPRHPGAEMNENIRKDIIRDLGLKEVSKK